MDYRLRDFQASDGPAVNAVALAAFSQFQHAYSDWPTLSRGLGQMVAMADSSEIVVAESDGQVVGAVAYVGPGRPKKEFFSQDWPIVRMLVVLPECRGFGIGRALTEACIQRARRDGAAVIALHTSPMMAVALPMYQRMGFRLEREVPPIFGVPYGIYVKQLCE
jgi:ribosomal protein S18 acetylase RimI-like enzyme